MGFLFFILFGLTLLGMYVAIRRQLAPVGLVAAIGMAMSIITMTLYLMSQVESEEQGIIFGILIGAFFAFATLAVAWFFQTQDSASEGVIEYED
jgi:multisubunit Na+/H+ antiporter MnhB subunit